MIKINQTANEIILNDKTYNFTDIINYLTNTTYQVVVDILKENKVSLPRKVRMDAMRATLRPSIIKTRTECLTLDQKLNYRLLWFNDFSEEQMSFYFEYFKSKELNRLYASKFYRNILIYLANIPSYEKCVEDLINVAYENKDLVEKEIKIKDIIKLFDEFFYDNKNTIDGLLIDKFRPVIYNSATKKQVIRIGLKYGISIPEKINKQTICAYVVEKLKAMGINTNELTSKITQMQVKDIRKYALDNGLETGSELNKKEMIEYILQRAEPTRVGYQCPENDRVYEMRIPITDEESVYEKIIIEQTRLQDELSKKDSILNKKHGEELERAKQEFLEKEEAFKKNQAELSEMQEKYEENLVNFDEEIKEEKSKVNENELVKQDRSSLKIDDAKATNLGQVEENLEEEITNETYNLPANEYDEVGNLLNQGNILPKVSPESNMIANTNKESDLIVFEPQKQDLILYEQLEKNKIHRRSMLSLILIILAFLLIVALGTSIYRILTTYTLLNADNFDLAPKNKEALQPLSDKTLTVSPYEFNGMLDLRNYYKSKSSSLNFEYYEKKGKTSEYSNVKYVKNISLSDIYKRRNEKLNYVAKVIFKTTRKYYYVDLDFDFKNVINIKTPKGDVVSSWKEYIEYPGTYQGFFEKELREKGKNILNPFTSKNDPIKRDIETWYFDKSRQERFDRNKLIDIKRNAGIKENIIYSNNAFSNNFNVSYKFLYKNNVYGDFNAKPNENISENNKNYLKNLEQRFPYPSVKINSDGSYGDDLEELINARNYYKLIGWFYLEDYPEVGISKGDEFKIDNIVPNLTYMTYKIGPRFERIALDIYYMESDDITQNESNYSLINKKKTRATLTKNNLGYDFEYNLEDYTKEYEEKYFINWIFKNGDKINNNDKFDISNLEFDKKNVYAYPKFEKYIYTEFYLLNFENLKLEKIKGKKNETILSKKKLIDKNRDTIEEVENYKYGQNEFLGYYLSDGSNLTDDLTFEQVLRYSSKVEIRYKKVPISITFKRYFYNSSIKNTQSEEIKTFTKYYETGINKLGDVVNDYKYEILAKYPDYIMENKEDDFNLKLVDIYKFNFTITLKAPSIMLQVKVKDNENYITYTVFKDQVLPMDINYRGNEEIKGYKIYEKVNGGVVETDITLFPNDNLNTLITNKNNNKTYIADAILQRSRTGIIQIEKIFIDEHKNKTDPLYIRKYIVSEKLRNLPLGDKPGDPQNGYYEQSGYVLNDFIKTNENEVSDYDRFEYVSMDGAWPDYKNKETKYTYYYRLARMETFVNCQGINIPTYDAPYEVINFTIEEKIKDNERFKHYIKKFKEYIKTHVGTDENYERHIKYVKVAKAAQAELGTRISYDEFLNLVVKKEWLKHPDYISSHLNGANFTLVVEKV